MKTEHANIAELQGKPAFSLEPGDWLIKISTAAELEDVSVATVWNKIRTDPTYPKPVYDAKGMARLSGLKHRAYMTATYSEDNRPKDRAHRARIGIGKRERAAA